MTALWKTKNLSPSSLHLDSKNPRLGREVSGGAPRELIQYLFDNDKALDVAESIATRGFFPNEPLLAVRENERYIVVEGNRRLAALKALREPGLLEGIHGRAVERLARKMLDASIIEKVPVTIAPSRRDTDRQIAGRHIGTPVLSWRAENRASFILDKLQEGYDNDSLRDELGFKLVDIQKARQTRAVADMARSLDLPEEVMAKLEGPTAKIITTLERVLDSSVGRDFLHAEPDPEHGLKFNTTKTEVKRGFSKLVEDVALGRQSSRTLNKNEDIEKYFKSWEPDEKPAKKRGRSFPSDIIKGKTVSAQPSKKKQPAPKKPRVECKTILPKDLRIRHGSDRLIDIRGELVKLKREDFPNAGAVLLRVFFELAVIDYLDRTGELKKIVKKIEGKTGKLPFGIPKMKQLVPELSRIAEAHLTTTQASLIKKAITPNTAAPFSISDLNAFIHSHDLPGGRDIQQFWLRVEPLVRLMLEEDVEPSK